MKIIKMPLLFGLLTNILSYNAIRPITYTDPEILTIGTVGPFSNDQSELEIFCLYGDPSFEESDITYELGYKEHKKTNSYITYSSTRYYAKKTVSTSVRKKIPLTKFVDGYDIRIRLLIGKIVFYSKEFSVAPIKSNKTINPFLLTNKKYTSPNYIYSYSSGKETEKKSTFEFYYLKDTFKDTQYVYLNFEEQEFYYNPYSPISSFPYKDVYIRFLDYYSLFPNIRKSPDGYKHIPLGFKAGEDGTTFIYMKNSFYYLEKTRSISIDYRAGFKNVNFFYLPPNFKYYADSYKFEVCMMGVGLEELNVIYTMDVNNSSNYVGLCADSEYCASGGILF